MPMGSLVRYYETPSIVPGRAPYVRRERARASRSFSPAQKKAIRRMVKSDRIRNFHDTEIATGTDILSTGVPLYDLTDMVQGDGEGERINDECELTSLQYRMLIGTGGGATTLTAYNVRLVWFIWRPDSNIDAPLTADILPNSDFNELFSGDSAARGKFKVVADKTVQLVDDESNRSRVLKGYFKLKDIVKFNPSATSGRNKLYLLALSNTAVSNAVEMHAHFRVHYSEK